MEDATGAARHVQTSQSGHILTPDEAAFLKKYLLGSKPIVVVGTEGRRAGDATKSVRGEVQHA